MNKLNSNHNVRFQVSLSNGETLFEGKGDYQEIPDAPSPWQRLISYSIKNKLSITSLSLYTEDGRTFNLPSAGRNPKFAVFDQTEKPIDYILERHISRDIEITPERTQGKTVISGWFTAIVAIYPTFRLEIWVDEKNPRNSWSLVRKI